MKLSRRCHAVLGLACIPPWTVNAGIVAGEERTLLVDTGYSAAAARTLLGYAEAVRPGNALVAVVTEPHLDHVLGIATLRDHGVDVLGHAGVARSEADLRAEREAYAVSIGDAARRAAREEEVFFAGTTVANPNVSVSADTTLDLGSAPVRLLLTPGHTRANLSVHVPDDGVVFTGDCVVQGYLPNLEASDPAGWEQWIGSLDRLAAIAPRVLVPGHGDVLIGAAVLSGIDAVRRVLEAALRRGVPPTGARRERWPPIG